MDYVEINPRIELFINRHSTPSWIIEDATTSFIDLTGKDVELPFPLISNIGEPEELLSLYNELTFEWLKKSIGYERN